MVRSQTMPCCVRTILTLWGLLLIGCDSGPGLPPLDELTRDEAWQFEVQYLADELADRHNHAFFQTPEAMFRREAGALREAVPALADHEVAVGMMRLAALLGDAHTSVNPWSQLAWHRYPLRLQWFDDGLFVVEVSGSEHHDLLRARLVQVGQLSAEDAMERVRAVVAHENDQWFRELAPDMAMTAEVLHAQEVLPELEHGSFVFERDGARFEVELTALSRSQPFAWRPALETHELPLYLRETEQFYWYEYLSESRTLYVNYNRCREMAGYPFPEFAREVFAVADTQPVDRFVVDLRLNAGGNSSIIRPLLDGLKERPTLRETGRLFVIIGQRTFSSGLLNAIELKRDIEAILIGTPTGGAPNGYGEVKSFELPYSHYDVRYSTKYFSLLDTNVPTLSPNIEVPLTAADYFAAHDPVLTAILESGPETGLPK